MVDRTLTRTRPLIGRCVLYLCCGRRDHSAVDVCHPVTRINRMDGASVAERSSADPRSWDRSASGAAPKRLRSESIEFLDGDPSSRWPR